jgi:fructosamine-3-kinase
MTPLAAAIAGALGDDVAGVEPLGTGTGGRVELHRVLMADGRRLVAKSAPGGLAVEGWMLGELARRSDLPVPQVLYTDEQLLLMEQLESGGPVTRAVEMAAADHLAALHGLEAEGYGLSRDTVIGSLPQPNPLSDDWPAFFRNHRLWSFARAAEQDGRLGAGEMAAIDWVATRIDGFGLAPAVPSLIHGDVWAGNVLVGTDGRLSGFIDPAIYHADPEVELAFIRLFGTFGEAFFDRYAEHRPFAPGFDRRCDLYNLYPLLVHVRLFGAAYVSRLSAVLRRLGAPLR